MDDLTGWRSDQERDIESGITANTLEELDEDVEDALDPNQDDDDSSDDDSSSSDDDD